MAQAKYVAGRNGDYRQLAFAVVGIVVCIVVLHKVGTERDQCVSANANAPTVRQQVFEKVERNAAKSGSASAAIVGRYSGRTTTQNDKVTCTVEVTGTCEGDACRQMAGDRAGVTRAAEQSAVCPSAPEPAASTFCKSVDKRSSLHASYLLALGGLNTAVGLLLLMACLAVMRLLGVIGPSGKPPTASTDNDATPPGSSTAQKALAVGREKGVGANLVTGLAGLGLLTATSVALYPHVSVAARIETPPPTTAPAESLVEAALILAAATKELGGEQHRGLDSLAKALESGRTSLAASAAELGASLKIQTEKTTAALIATQDRVDRFDSAASAALATLDRKGTALLGHAGGIAATLGTVDVHLASQASETKTLARHAERSASAAEQIQQQIARGLQDARALQAYQVLLSSSLAEGVLRQSHGSRDQVCALVTSLHLAPESLQPGWLADTCNPDGTAKPLGQR